MSASVSTFCERPSEAPRLDSAGKGAFWGSVPLDVFPIQMGDLLLLERLNAGGMAEIFKAKTFGAEGFERIVALKRLLPAYVDNEDVISMFIDEARIAAQLTHQNIVQIYALGKHEGAHFISMEYIAGRDLREILNVLQARDEPMEPLAACWVVARTCEALDYAHRKRDAEGRELGIIHRDVTPQNVIISNEGEVKLCDFGIVKAASRLSRTQAGVLKGKYAYMAPEQVRGRTVDRRSDIFSLGAIFYEMLTGHRLFQGASDYAILEAVHNAQIPSPRTFVPDVSPEIEGILLRMLARDPNERYPWASEVLEDIAEVMHEDEKLFDSRHLRALVRSCVPTTSEAEEQTQMLPRGGRPDVAGQGPYPSLESEALRPIPDNGDSPVENRFGAPYVADRESFAEWSLPEMVRPASRAGGTPNPVCADDEKTTLIENSDDDATQHGRPPTDAPAPAQVRRLIDEPVLERTSEGTSPDETEGETHVKAPWRGARIESVFDVDIEELMRPDSNVDGAKPVEVTEDLDNAPSAIVRAVVVDGPLPAPSDAVPFVPRNLQLRATPVGERNLGDHASPEPSAVLDLSKPVPGEASASATPPPLHSASDLEASVERATFRDGAQRPPVGATAPRSPVGATAPRSPVGATAPRPPVGAMAQRSPAGARARRMIAAMFVLMIVAVAFVVALREPSTASLEIMSPSVDGAEVFLDGALVGRTPLRVANVSLGDHHVRIEARDHVPFAQTIHLRTARPHMMFVPLQSQ